MISGAQWVPRAFFDRFYRARIEQAAADGKNFVVGAADGVDAFAQEMLTALCPDRVTVYDKGARDGRRCDGFALRNGFASYPERDAAMLAACSGNVIAVLPQMGGACSGVLPLVLPSCTPDTLATLRAASELYDAVLFAQVAAVYAKHYA